MRYCPKAVVTDHVGVAARQFVTLDEAREAHVEMVRWLDLGRFLQFVRALQFLGADVEQLHARQLELKHDPGVSGAHHRELDEVVGVALGIGAEIEHHDIIGAQGRQHGGERRPVDAGHGPQCQLGHRHQRAGIPAESAAWASFLYRGDGAAHRAGLGAADRLGRLVVARDDVLAMDDLADVGEAAMLGELDADRVFVAEQHEAEIVAAVPGVGGARDHHFRAGIATHRVDCDPAGPLPPKSPVCSRTVLRFGLEDFTSLIMAATLAQIVRQAKLSANRGIPDSRSGFGAVVAAAHVALGGRGLSFGDRHFGTCSSSNDVANAGCDGQRRTGRSPRGPMLSHEGSRL